MTHRLSDGPRRARIAAGVLLLAILAAELAFSAKQQSQTFDEAAHIFTGYQSWKTFDFGIGPETAPLARLVASIPLLRLSLRTPPIPNGYFRAVEYLGGHNFLYSNDADALLFRARMAAATFTAGLAITVFFLAYSMWGAGPAFLALILVVFEPNFLAHGALVTTDMGLACCLFLAVAGFYWYQRKPSAARLAGTGLATGLCLGVKHSGILVFPILLALSLAEVFFVWRDGRNDHPTGRRSVALRQVRALTLISGTAVLVLWSLYGFRFSARPSGSEMVPPFSGFVAQMNPSGANLIALVEPLRLLPESYLYGWVDILALRGATATSLFGKVYPHGQWFYFPAVFVIKSTLPFLILCLLVPATLALWKAEFRRELIFLAVPPAVYVAVAATSAINYGVRHLLPVYPFLILLAAFCAWRLAQSSRMAAAFILTLFLFHAFTSLRAFPNYLPYTNELWGGPKNAYRILADSNVDWGQGLKAMKEYLETHHIRDCWFAYYASVVADLDYYKIPCKPLPSSFAAETRSPMQIVPPFVDGPVFISASEISGTLWSSDEANPYAGFRKKKPAAVIAGSILVFEGRTDVSAAAALTHESTSADLLNMGKFDDALSEAELAISLAPNRAEGHVARGNVFARMKRDGDAMQEFEIAREFASALRSSRQ